MTFVHQALLGAMLLTLLPLLIHVINLVRHRRVQWAAMEFLLASYRRHRRWVWLKQFLLMLTRMAIVALVVMMCAQWVTQDQLLAIFGGRVVHHYVLLDDSYSMSQQTGGASAHSQATQFVARLLQETAQLDTQHRLTLLRTSQLRKLAPGVDRSLASQVGQHADLQAEPMNAELLRRFEQLRQNWQPGELADPPFHALPLLRELMDPAAAESRVVYLLSDFRQRDWDVPAIARDELRELQRLKSEIHFIDCARDDESNLGVVELTTEADTRAAGIPLFVQLKIRNHGRSVARRIPIRVRTLFFNTSSGERPGEAEPQREELPLVLMEKIEPGETISKRVQVYFPQAGQHLVEVELPADAVATDNLRRLAVDLPDGEKALVIDGSIGQQHAYFLGASFNPLERSNTGVTAEVKPPAFLRDTSFDTLRSYSAIYLCDVPRIDPQGIALLEQYLQSGGGIAIFAGEGIDAAFYRQTLYNEGRGFLPVALERPVELPLSEETSSPDFTVSDHPVFSFFRGERNSFLAGVTIARYCPLIADAKTNEPDKVETLAELRNGQPLFVEKHFGAGRVIVCGTTAAPLWNDWARNPSFVVLVLRLHAYLAAARRHEPAYQTGDVIRLEWEKSRYLPELSFFFTTAAGKSKTETKANAIAGSEASLLLAQFDATEKSGWVEAVRTTPAGAIATNRFAINVDPAEGNLSRAPVGELLLSLEPVKIEFHRVEEVGYLAASQAGQNRSLLVMTVLLLLLLIEQALAYSASYHTSVAAGGAR